MKKSILFLVLMFFISASCVKDKLVVSEFIIKNDTGYDVVLNYLNPNHNIVSYNIPFHSQYLISESAIGGIYSNDLDILFQGADSVALTYDGEKMEVHTIYSPHDRNILNIENYFKKTTENRNTRTHSFLFTITEEDYKRAVPIDN